MRQEKLREVINMTKVTKLDIEKPGLYFQYIIHIKIKTSLFSKPWPGWGWTYTWALVISHMP